MLGSQLRANISAKLGHMHFFDGCGISNLQRLIYKCMRSKRTGSVNGLSSSWYPLNLIVKNPLC